MKYYSAITKNEIMSFIYIYNENYSAITKNEIMSFAATWTDLEIILLSK